LPISRCVAFGAPYGIDDIDDIDDIEDSALTHSIGVSKSSVIQTHAVRECLLAYEPKSIDARGVADVLQRCNVVMTTLKKADYSPADIEQDLARLLEGNTIQHNLRTCARS